LTGYTIRLLDGPQAGRLTLHEWMVAEIDFTGPRSAVTALESTDIVLLPMLVERLADLSAARRQRIRDGLLAAFSAGYTYLNQAGVLQTVGALDLSDVLTSGTLTGGDMLARLSTYLAHREATGKEGVVEAPHNTEFLDDFATDPFTGGRFSNVTANLWTYDGTNFEIDCPGTGGAFIARRDSDVGSLDMETQGTILLPSDAGAGYPGPSARNRPSADTHYALEVETSGTGTVYYIRRVAGANTDLGGSDALTFTDSVWCSVRLATQTNGAQVDLSVWRLNHTGTKPADPGWIGVDGTPDATLAGGDTNAARILDSDAQRGGVVQTNAAATSTDWFKVRAVSDRGGAGAFLARAPYVVLHAVRRAANF
jgi:hypothetical protein